MPGVPSRILPLGTIAPAPAAGAEPAAGPVLVSDDRVPARSGLSAVMSHIVRRGRWELPRVTRVASFMGQVNLDLTQVALAPGVSSIEIFCVLGEVKIVVPHTIRVVCEGNPIMGEFEIKTSAGSLASPDAPLVRISGAAVAGSVHVRVVDPTATPWWKTWLLERRRRAGRLTD